MAAMRKSLPRTTDGSASFSINIYAEWGWGVRGEATTKQEFVNPLLWVSLSVNGFQEVWW